MAGVALELLTQAFEFALATLAFGAGGIRVDLLAFEVGELAAHPRVLPEVTEVALHRGGIAGERFLLRAHATGDVHDGAVSLELREG